jgi:hypothetical protein
MHWGFAIVFDVLRRFRHALIAIVALALSAGLAFGAQPSGAGSWGLSNAATHAGKTVPVGAGADESTDADEDTETEETDEDTETDQDTEDAGDHCTDPTTLTEEELAALNHGSIVCWAAHQTEWPEWFANHGSFVRCWAHQGKADAISCTEAPTAEAAATSHGNGKGKTKTKTNGKP